jgi:predicted RNA binding protein YcfA (HicA-like mRNA interferase family)
MSAKLPQIKGERLVNALKKIGWYVDRTSGSHVIMKNENKPRHRVVIPVHGRAVKTWTLNKILKDAELSVEELKELI